MRAQEPETTPQNAKRRRCGDSQQGGALEGVDSPA